MSIAGSESLDSDELIRTLSEIESLSPGWDRDGAPAPTTAALGNARAAIRLLTERRVAARRVTPDVNGGICVTLRSAGDAREAVIYLENSGDVWVNRRHLPSRGDDPQPDEGRSVQAAVEQACAFCF